VPSRRIFATARSRRSRRRFVEQLHTVMSGSYLTATRLHDDDACPFGEEETLALKSIETR